MIMSARMHPSQPSPKNKHFLVNEYEQKMVRAAIRNLNANKSQHNQLSAFALCRCRSGSRKFLKRRGNLDGSTNDIEPLHSST
jgi:hypothetical protein